MTNSWGRKPSMRIVVELDGSTKKNAAGVIVPMTSCVIERCDLTSAMFDELDAKEQAILDALHAAGAAGATQTEIKQSATGCESGGPLYEGAKQTLLEHRENRGGANPRKKIQAWSEVLARRVCASGSPEKGDQPRDAI